MSTEAAVGRTGCLEEEDHYEACDPSSHHIGKTKASLLMRPIARALTCFPWATRCSQIANFTAEGISEASISGGFDEARRNAFIQVAESVSGPNRLKFFNYRPHSYTSWFNEFTTMPNGDENCSPQATLKRSTLAMEREEIACGEFFLNNSLVA